MARIDPLDPAAASEPVRTALESLPPLNIFGTLAHAQTAFRPLLRFGGAVLNEMELDAAVRELAILAVAKEAEAEYEWTQHVAIAKAVGVTDEQIQAVAEGHRDASAFDARQQVAVELAAAVVQGPRVSDELYARVAAQFSERQIVELLIAIGAYLMFARLMTTLEMDLDEPAGDAVLTGLRDRPGDGA
jgi:alkylhydroperoxidase family enzyme